VSRAARRPYHSPKRAAQARDTRDQLLAAAHRAFRDRGYAGATVAEIAAEAGVSAPTVFAVFGSKQQLLADVVAAAVAGPGNPGPLADQQDWRQMLADPDPIAVLRRFAALTQAINARSWPIIEAAREAAATQPGLADLLRRGAANRRADCQTVARALADAQSLRAGLDLAQAADILWALCGSELYRMLVAERQWPPGQYTTWLAESLHASLIGPAPIL
jgi:AcrR family transcriptional regulator